VILLPLLLAAQAPAETPPDVVVIGDKLKRLRLSTDIARDGHVRACQVTISSGDAAIDRQACLSTRDCVSEGKRGGEALADCVDAKLVAFVRSGLAG
jgi:hypothetical protein